MITLNRKPGDRLLELGGGERPLVHPKCMGDFTADDGIIYKSLYFTGYSDYWINTNSEVFSYKNKKWRKLKPSINPDGYLVLNLCNSSQRLFHIHRLMLEAFVGPCPFGCEGCHNDGNPQNNNLSNLRWDTRQGNCNDTKTHRKTTFGENAKNAKLTDDIVRLIKNSSEKQRNLAKTFNVSEATISSIKHGTRWKHIK